MKALLAFLLSVVLLPSLHAQNDTVTVGPSRVKSVDAVEQWSYNGSAWVRGNGAAATIETPTVTTVSTSGSVAAGSRDVTFIFSSDFTGTVLGVAFVGGTDLPLHIVPSPGAKLAIIAYTRSAGSIRIIDLR